MNEETIGYKDYILRTIGNDKWMSYDKTNIPDEITTNKYLQENFDLSLDELKEFIEKYEPERLI